MEVITQYQTYFTEYLNQKTSIQEPVNLYSPINYILNLGGKRIRPTLVLLSCDVFGGSYKKALDAAMAIEIFHNFSLVHDDIMDGALIRRGKATVHKKWNLNTGILSGDLMLIKAYQSLETYDGSKYKLLNTLFTNTAKEVCEGQQYDIDFENRNDVSISEYIKMITYKTAVLLGASMKMGAIIASAPEKDQQNIYDFGTNLGVAFQLQDDFLDAFGDENTFGKRIGGDIIENKKTFLYITAYNKANKNDKKTLDHLYSKIPKDPTEKINIVKEIFVSTGAMDETKKEISKYTNKAFQTLERIPISPKHKTVLESFGKQLMFRQI